MSKIKQYAFLIERETEKGTKRTVERVFSTHLSGAVRKWYQNSTGTIVGLVEV